MKLRGGGEIHTTHKHRRGPQHVPCAHLSVLHSTVRAAVALGLKKAGDSGCPAEGVKLSGLTPATQHRAFLGTHHSSFLLPCLSFHHENFYQPLRSMNTSPGQSSGSGARRGTQMRGLMGSRVLMPAPSALDLSLPICCNGPLVARGGLGVGGWAAGSHSGGHLSWSQPCTCQINSLDPGPQEMMKCPPDEASQKGMGSFKYLFIRRGRWETGVR